MRKKKNVEESATEPRVAYEDRIPTQTLHFKTEAYYWSRAEYEDENSNFGFPGMSYPVLFRLIGALILETNELRERVESLESSQAETPTSDPPRQ